MALTIIFLGRVRTVDVAPVSAHPNWGAEDTLLTNEAPALPTNAPFSMPLRDFMGQVPKGYMREFAVSNVVGDRTVLYAERGVYLFRVTSAGQSIKLRLEPSTIGAAYVLGGDYATDAAANTSPDDTSGLGTDAGQPLNKRHHIVRETEGPRRLYVASLMKIGVLASALTTNVEVEFAG
jgi:hypothetical protein